MNIDELVVGEKYLWSKKVVEYLGPYWKVPDECAVRLADGYVVLAYTASLSPLPTIESRRSTAIEEINRRLGFVGATGVYFDGLDVDDLERLLGWAPVEEEAKEPTYYKVRLTGAFVTARNAAIALVQDYQAIPDLVDASRTVDALIAEPELLVRLAIEAGALKLWTIGRSFTDEKDVTYTYESSIGPEDGA